MATTLIESPCLIIDIGGASTEIVIGNEANISFITSMDIGSVANSSTKYNRTPSILNFVKIKNQVQKHIQPHLPAIQNLKWRQAVGNSGIFQTIFEILEARKQPAVITLPILENLKEESICSFDKIPLSLGRKATFVVGLGVLSALFEILPITELLPAKGALREGLLFQVASKINAKLI